MYESKETLVIYQKYLDLIYYTNNLCIKYPKSEKLALASETKQAMYLGLRHLLYAFKEYNKKGISTYLISKNKYLHIGYSDKSNISLTK